MEFFEKLLKTCEIVFPVLLIIFGILGLTGAIQIADIAYQIVLIALPAIQAVLHIWITPKVTASVERRGRRNK